MADILLHLTTRLNYLIGLLDISSKDTYEKIKGHKIFPEFESVGEIYDHNYAIYSNQITTSAILLGYAYFEAYLSDLITICIAKKPKVLIPNGKTQIKDKTITYEKLLLSDSFEQLLGELIEKEVRNIMFKPMPEILEYLDNKLKLTWDKSLNSEIIVANKIRNCCMHNNCIADRSLAKDKRFVEGEEIILTSSSVHSFGLKARQFTRELWQSAEELGY